VIVGLAVLSLLTVDVAHRRVDAADGTALALYRYGAPGAPAVLMIPDLGFNRAVFDIEGEGLARYLAEHGHTVYVAELRTHGLDKRIGDLKSVLDVIGPADLVAHGYAGTLAMAANDPRIRRVVAVSTPVLLEVPNKLTRDFLLAGPGDAFDLLFAMDGRFRTGRLDALRAHAPAPIDGLELEAWMKRGDLTVADGTTVLQRLRAYDKPTLMFLGLADTFAPPELATPLVHLSKAEVHLHTFSRADLDHEDYSHLSLLQGENARSDVWEPALRFLE
jgi:pimeloyl-ACP methyl ester carboxylesterase